MATPSAADPFADFPDAPAETPSAAPAPAPAASDPFAAFPDAPAAAQPQEPSGPPRGTAAALSTAYLVASHAPGGPKLEDAPDFEGISSHSPAMAEHLSTPSNWRAAPLEYDKLSWLERYLTGSLFSLSREPGEEWTPPKWMAGLAAGSAGVLAQAGELDRELGLLPFSTSLGAERDAAIAHLKAVGELEVPTGNLADQAVVGAARAAPFVAANIVAASVGGWPAAFSMNTGLVYPEQKKRLSEVRSPSGEALDPTKVKMVAGAASLAEGAAYTFGVGPLAKGISGPAARLAPGLLNRVLTSNAVLPLVTRAVVRAGVHGATGASALAFAGALDDATLQAAKVKAGAQGEFDWTQVYDSGADSFKQGMIDFALFSMWSGGRRMLNEAGVRSASLREQEALAGAAKYLEGIKDPEAVEVVVDKVARGKTALVERSRWDAYWQDKGIDPKRQAAEVAGAGTNPHDMPGDFIALPLSRYLSRFGGSEHLLALAPDVKLDPSNRTAREQVAFDEAERRLETEAQKARGAQFELDKRAVADIIREQAVSRGVDADDAAANANTIAEAAGSVAIKTDTSVKQATILMGLQRYKVLGTSAEAIAQATSEQLRASMPAEELHTIDLIGRAGTGDQLAISELGRRARVAETEAAQAKEEAKRAKAEIMVEPLTQLGSRKAFETYKAAQKGEGWEVAIDVNDLGAQDLFGGHATGNKLLTIVADAMRAAKEKTGHKGELFRWGGDEFHAGGFETPEAARAFAGALKEHLAGADPAAPGYKASVAIGIAQGFEAADAATYKAKAEKKAKWGSFNKANPEAFREKAGHGESFIAEAAKGETAPKPAAPPAPPAGEAEIARIGDKPVTFVPPVAPPGRAMGRIVTPQRPAGEPIRYRVIEAAELIPSHTPDSFAPHPDYPAGVQERDYRRQPEEQMKVTRGAQQLDPSFLLSDTPSPLDGPPIVTSGDRAIVLGGNGRSMMLLRGIRDPATAERYRAALEQRVGALGISPAVIATMKAPILVREVEGVRSDAAKADMTAAVRRFNEGMTQALSPKVRAVAEAKSLTPETVRAIGDVLSGSEGTLRDVMREQPAAVVEILRRDGIITSQNQTEWVKGRNLTEEGKDRIEGMFVGRVVGTADRMMQTPSALLAKVERIAPALVKVEGVNPLMAETETVQKAIDLLNEARQRNVELDKVVNQVSLFGEERPSPAVVAMARLLESGKPKEIRDRFEAWAARASFDPRQATLFGGNVTQAEARAVLLGAEVKVEQGPKEYGGLHRPPGPESGAPAHDLTGGGKVYPEDVYGPNAARYYGHGERALDAKTVALLHALRGKPDAEVIVYRAVPKGTKDAAINAGDWVTVNRDYAKAHGERFDGGADILSRKVKASDIFTNGDSIHEFGYWPTTSVEQKSSQTTTPADEGPRGMVRMRLDATGRPMDFPIQLLAGDASTLAHETGHFFSWAMHDVAMSDKGAPAFRADYDALLKWAGFASPEARLAENLERAGLEAREDSLAPAEKGRLADLRAKEEKIGHGWELYFAEGRAPSRQLARSFAWFRRSITDVYRGLFGAGDQYRRNYGRELGLSEEIRGIFDRWLAAETEVSRSMAADPIPAEVLDKLNPADRDALLRARDDRRDETEAGVYQALTQAEKDQHADTRAQVRQRVADELDASPVWRAIDYLTRDQSPEAGLIDVAMGNLSPDLIDASGRSWKLDLAEVKEALGEEGMKGLPRGITARKGGMPLDFLAERLGFQTGEEMLTALKGAGKRDAAIEARTQARMEALFPSMVKDPEAVAKAAVEAEHTLEAAVEALVGARILARSVDPALGMRLRIMEDRATRKANAERLVAGTPVSALSPALYLRAERSAGKKALELTGKALGRDTERRKEYAAEAMDARDVQLLNMELWRAATDAIAKAEKDASTLADYQRPGKTRAEVGKAHETLEDGRVSQPYLEQIDALLAAVEFGNASRTAVAARASTLADIQQWIQNRWLDGDSIIFPPKLMERLQRVTHWKDLTPAELTSFREAVESIAEQAKQRTTFEVGKQKMETNQVISELAAAALENGAKVRLSLVPANKTTGEAVAEGARQVLDAIRRPEGLYSALDGYQANGPWKRYIWDPISDASYHFHDLVRRASEPVRQILRDMPWSERQRIRNTRFEINGETYTLENAIVVGLQMGNESNASKLVRGMSDPSLIADFNVQPWNGRETRDAILSQLTAPDVKIINEIHRALESYWEAASALETKDTGVAPKKVQTKPFKFKNKDGVELVIEGGYYPVIYSRMFRIGKRQDEADMAAINGLPGLYDPAYQRAMTPNGYLQERIESYARPFDLTLDALPRKLTMTAKDIAFRMAAKQAYRVLIDQRIVGALQQALGYEGHSLILGHLRDAVNDVMIPEQGAGLALRVMSKMRSLTYQNAFALNVAQSLQNFADPVGISAVMPPRFFASAALDISRRRGAAIAEILAESSEMRMRSDGLSKSLNRDIEDTFRKSVPGLAWDRISEVMLLPFETTQKMTEFPTYAGAKAHALAPKEKGGLGLGQEEAVRHAQDMVRKMFGGHRTIDLTPVQRHKILRWGTMFWGWSSAKLDQFITATGKGKAEWSEGRKAKAIGTVAKAFANLYALQVVSSILVGRGPKDEDDDGMDPADIGEWLAWKGVGTLPSFVPVVSQVSRGLEGDIPQRDVQMTPWLNLLNGPAKAMKKTGAYITHVAEDSEGDDEAVQLFIAWLEAGGQFAGGAPVGQVRKTSRYWMDREPDAALGEDVLGTAYGPSKKGSLSNAIYGR